MLGRELLVGEAAAGLRLDAVEDLEQELAAESGVADGKQESMELQQPCSQCAMVIVGGHGRIDAGGGREDAFGFVTQT